MKPGMAVVLAAMSAASLAEAQPTITSLGSGTPVGVTQAGGIDYVTAGNTRWTLNGGAISLGGISGVTGGGGQMSADGNFVVVTVANDVNQVSGNTATGVTPAFSTTPTLVAAPIATTEQGAAVWDASTGTLKRLGGLPIVPELMVYGSGSSGGSTGAFVSPLNISSGGRFVVGQAYISSYNSAAGTTISSSTFQWRPFLWDSQANGGAGGYTVLPTPFRTSSNTWRRRTGSAMCVSSDGLVIAGAQEHNVSSGPAADPDGGRPVVWRWNAGTSSYDMTFLPNGVNGSGQYYTVSISGGSMLMNAAGTIIVGPAVDNSGAGYLGKWVWNAGTSSWDAPVAVVPQMATPATWLPGAVTGCGVPPSLSLTAMTEDASVIVGQARYSTCGSFMSGGFIWHAADGVTKDWYDYLVSLNTPGVAQYYGPIGDNGDPTRGLPRLGFPRDITPDGNVIVGAQGGNQLIPGAVPTIVHMTGGPTCVAPVITLNPNNLMYSRCSIGTTLSSIILNGNAAGTMPISLQWSKNGQPLSDGPTAWGSGVTGSSSFQLRVTTPGPLDAGNYSVTATGCGGGTATSTAATVQTDPAAVTPPNDTCETATDVGEGTFNFNICGAYTASGFGLCAPVTVSETGDVWYRYTPTFTGNARFQTCGSGYDTTLQLNDGCSGTILACNDNVGSRGLIGTTCASTRSMIASYPVVAGQAIHVRVSSMSSPTATGALTISQAPAAPANDLCMNATPAGLGTYPFDLTEATDDYTFGTDFCNPGQTQTASNRDVWFRLSSPCDLGGTYTITTCGSTITNPMLHVFDACFGNIIACHDNVGSGVAGCTSNQARIMDLTVSGPVLVRVSASGASVPNSGLGQIVVTGSHNACPPVCGTSDFNGDGDFGTDADIEAFFACLAGNCCPTCFAGGSDFNGDGDFGTDADIESFFRVLGGGPC